MIVQDEYIPWLPIKLYPEECLNIPCEDVVKVDSDLHTFIGDMAQTMYSADGIGLAAPQVGKNIRIIVVDCSKDRSGLKKLINPKIVERRGHVQSTEGCLSFPGLTLQVSRAKEIDVVAINTDGDEISFTATGLEAICIQHEVDHLDGITFEKQVSRQVRRAAFRKWDPEKEKKKLTGEIYD